MSFQSLTASSTPEQIAAAYRDYSNIAGNNVAVQGAARTMLLNKGVAAPAIDQAFSLFANPVELKAAPAPVVQQPVATVPVAAPKTAVSTPAAVQKPPVTTAAPATAPAAGGVSDAFVLSWLARNPNPTTAQIAALKPFGVTADRVKSLSGASTTPAPVAALAAPKAVTPTAENPFPGMTVEDLYRMHAGKEPDAEGLAFWKSAFGPEISEAERAQFIKSVVDVQNKPAVQPAPAATSTATPAKPAAEQNKPTTIETLYQDVLGRKPSQAEIDSWGFGAEISPEERDNFLYAAQTEAIENKPKTGAVGNLAQQILGQNLTDKWSGEGWGSAESNAYDMAAILASAGITDISQFGVRDKTVTTEDTYNEQGVDTYGSTSTVPEYYNKLTGEAIPFTHGGGQGNSWGGTSAGKGDTRYGVQFDAQGKPVFYTQYVPTETLVGGLIKDLGPIGQIGLAVATGGLSIPQQIAAQAAIGLASGKDFKDIAKSAAASFLMAGVSDIASIKEGAQYLNSVDPTGALAGAFQGAVMSGAKAGLTGQNIGDAVMSGAVSGGMSGAIIAALDQPEFKDLTATQKRLAANAMGGVLSGKPLDQVIINSAISAARAASKSAQNPAPVEDMGPTSYGTNVTQQLTDSGMDEVDLPTGIQTASSDGDGPFRVESAGAPIYADSPRAEAVKPPPGYRLMASTEEQEVQDADRTRYVKPSGAYYDYTANAWFVPSGEFDLSGVKDYSDLFNGDNQNLTDEDLSFIRGNDFGSGPKPDSEYTDFLESIGIKNPSSLGPSPSNQEILDLIGYQEAGSGAGKDKRPTAKSDRDAANAPGKRPTSEPDLGTIEVVGERPTPEPDFGTLEVIGERPTPEPDFGTMEIVGERPKPEPDLGTIEVVGERPAPEPDLGTIEVVGERPEPDLGTIDIVAPRPEPEVKPPVTPPVTPPVKPPVVKPPVTVPPQVVQQVALQLGVPATSQIAQDIAEALYGTMDYLDISEEFSPSARKARPAATQKQMQQTKMAQGGYLDAMLAEDMTADDLLNLLR
jgi:hypothetical protein